MAHRSVRTLTAVALAIAASACLASCAGPALSFGSTTSGAYEDLEGLRTDDDLDPPGWIPADAVSIRFTTDLVDQAAILAFRSPTHFADGTCDLLEATASAGALPAVPLDDSWWPKTPPAAHFACDDGWTAFVDGDTVYAYTRGSRTADERDPEVRDALSTLP
jgi:hypothetical protein